MTGKICNGISTPAENIGFAKNLKLSKAYADGAEATLVRNAARGDNPHTSETGEFVAWDAAWLDCVPVADGGLATGAAECTAYRGQVRDPA